MVHRRGMGKGQGKGYHNMMMKDPMVHSQSSRGIKQPQHLSPMVTRSAIAKYKSGNVTEKFKTNVVRVDDLVLKIEYKEYDKDYQNVNKRCKAYNLLHKKFPYYPECKIVQTKDKNILITDYEGEQAPNRLDRLELDQKKQLMEAMLYLAEKGIIVEDVRRQNVAIDNDGNAVIIDFGIQETFKNFPEVGFASFVRFNINALYDLYDDNDKYNRAYWMQRFLKKYPKTKLGGRYSFEVRYDNKVILSHDDLNFYIYLDYKDIRTALGKDAGLSKKVKDRLDKKLNVSDFKVSDKDIKKLIKSLSKGYKE